MAQNTSWIGRFKSFLLAIMGSLAVLMAFNNCGYEELDEPSESPSQTQENNDEDAHRVVRDALIGACDMETTCSDARFVDLYQEVARGLIRALPPTLFGLDTVAIDETLLAALADDYATQVYMCLSMALPEGEPLGICTVDNQCAWPDPSGCLAGALGIECRVDIECQELNTPCLNWSCDTFASQCMPSWVPDPGATPSPTVCEVRTCDAELGWITSPLPTDSWCGNDAPGCIIPATCDGAGDCVIATAAAYERSENDIESGTTSMRDYCCVDNTASSCPAGCTMGQVRGCTEPAGEAGFGSCLCTDPRPTASEVCTDGVDNDGDGSIDCADTDCLDSAFCGDEICNNGIDDDGDGDIDCADTRDCLGQIGSNGYYCCTTVQNCCAYNYELEPVLACPEYLRCYDGIDNGDTDGLVDCDDPDCFGNIACQTETNCTDGGDNDGDTLTDCADTDCAAFHGCIDEVCVIDGNDVDGDGFPGCDDPECEDDLACMPVPTGAVTITTNENYVMRGCRGETWMSAPSHMACDGDFESWIVGFNSIVLEPGQGLLFNVLIEESGRSVPNITSIGPPLEYDLRGETVDTIFGDGVLAGLDCQVVSTANGGENWRCVNGVLDGSP